MCSYQTLFYNEVTGYVIHCRQCNTIQLAFGNVLITLYKEDFYGFHQCINRIKEEYEEYSDCAKKCITVPTPCEGIKFLVSGPELAQLQVMVEEAETELKSLAMLSLFDQVK